MKYMKLLTIGVLSAAALTAQIPFQPAPLPPPDGPKQAVSGRVLDSVTGRPVRGVKVSLMQERSELVAAHTDFEGRFQIEDAPVGEWRAFAVKTGYSPRSERLTVPAAQPRTGVDLSLNRFGVIAGRVLDERNRPVVGARIVVFIPRESNDWSMIPIGMDMRGGQTDDRGEYRVWNLTPGAYVVAVAPSAEPSAAGALSFDAAGAFYPEAGSLSEAERIEVGWGQVREGVDLRLGPAAATRLEVQAVLPSSGGACERCAIQVLHGEKNSSFPMGETPLGPQNRVTIDGLPPGGYLVHLRGTDDTGVNMSHGLASVTVSEDRPEQLTVTAYGEMPVRGRIALEDPPEGPFRGGIRVMPSGPFLRLGMITRGMSANLSGEGPEIPFELTCFPGEVELQVMSQGYVAGVALDGKPLESPKLTVPPGGITGDLVVRIRFESGTLEGRVNLSTREAGGNPGGDYFALARPVGPDAAFLRSRTVRVQPDGSLRQELPPGKYELIAVPAEPGMQALNNDPGYTAKIRDHIRRVEIKADQTTNVTLDPAPAP